MASPVNFCLLVFIFTGSLCVRVDALLKKYVSLISDVQNFHGSSSVFFTYSCNDRRLPQLTLVQLLYRDLSRKGVFTLIINFGEVDERMNFYRRRIVRPLIVVLLTAVEDIRKFAGDTREMNVSYPIWLVIFADEYGDPICAYCNHSEGNIFHLQFNTEMLVSCCQNPMLQEWWSVRENQTEIADFAIWNKNYEFTPLTKEALYVRRHDLNGTALRVGIVTSSAFLRDRGYTVDGFLGDVLFELKRNMNFTIIAMLREVGFGSWSSKSKSWSGVVGHLARGQADIGVAEFTITNSRLDVVDFTLPLILSRSRLYIREPDGSGVQWSAYFQAFSVEIWIIIILIIITTPILLTVIIQLKGDTNLWLLIFVENYLYIWGIFCQQGLSEFPAETPLRIAYISIFASALVVSAAYSASLISFLTLYSPSLPFSSMSGFADDGTYGLIVYQNSSDYDLFASASDPVLSKMMTLMKPWNDLPQTVEDGFQQVCKDKVAFYTTEAGKQTMKIRPPCKFVAIESGRTDSLAMMMSADSQYTGLVNYHIQRFQDNGVLHRLKQRYFTKDVALETTHDTVSLGGVAPILSVLAGGIVLALVVLISEKIHCSVKSYGHRWDRVISPKTIMQRWFNCRRKQRTSRQELRSLVELRAHKLSALTGYYP